MNVSGTVVLSVFSAGIGVVGTWLAFQKFNNDQRERMLMERKQVILMERNLEVLKLEYESLSVKVGQLFEKLDTRCDQLERNQHEISGSLRALLERK